MDQDHEKFLNQYNFGAFIRRHIFRYCRGQLKAGLKYVEFSQMGNPAEVLEVKYHSAEVLNAGEVRVAVLAAPINPSDLLQIAGKYGVDPVLPSNPGSEGVGRVLEVSPEVKHLAVGQLVLLAGGSTWREQIVAPAALSSHCRISDLWVQR